MPSESPLTYQCYNGKQALVRQQRKTLKLITEKHKFLTYLVFCAHERYVLVLINEIETTNIKILQMKHKNLLVWKYYSNSFLKMQYHKE